MMRFCNKTSELTKYFASALNNKSWMTKKPVFDLAGVFDFCNQIDTESTLNYMPGDLYPTAVIYNVLKYKYPTLPRNILFGIHGHYIASDVFPTSLMKPMATSQVKAYTDYLESKLQSPTFPFPKAVPVELRRIYEVHYGIQAFCNDLYSPMLLQHLTAHKGEEPMEIAAKICRMAPTVCYDTPQDIGKTFPITFMLCNPFFTYPRGPASLKIWGTSELSMKLSLVDIFLSDKHESLVANFNPDIGAALIKALYPNDVSLQHTATLLMKRAIVSAGGDPTILPKADLAPFLLRKEQFRNSVKRSKQNTVHLMNIVELEAEAKDRKTKAQLEAVLTNQQLVAKAATRIQR